MMDQKGLRYHPTKTVFIAIGTEKYRKGVQKEVEKDPIMFGNFIVSFVESEVYLGDVLSAQGLEKSVELTINKRLPKVRGAMFKTKAIMEFSKHRPAGPMLSISQNVLMFVCLCVCVLTF